MGFENFILQTHYKGTLFRSRLEARWALFFDTLGIDWEYEPEKVALGGVAGNIIPDFWLPTLEVEGSYKSGAFAQIKPPPRDTAEDKEPSITDWSTRKLVMQCIALANTKSFPVLLLIGDPGTGRHFQTPTLIDFGKGDYRCLHPLTHHDNYCCYYPSAYQCKHQRIGFKWDREQASVVGWRDAPPYAYSNDYWVRDPRDNGCQLLYEGIFDCNHKGMIESSVRFARH
jgi:hypothetical protein